MTAALVCALSAGLTGCAGSPQTRGAYPIIPIDERPVAVSFFGLDSRQQVASTRGGLGRVQLVVYDVGPLTTVRQLSALREARSDARGVRLLRVTLDGRQLRSHDVFYEGRPTPDPRVTELHEQVLGLASAGLSYAEVVDRQGRVAARLVGTSDVARLRETLRRVGGYY